MTPDKPKTLSIVIPFYNEADNIPALFERLLQLEARLTNTAIEFVCVDDHSSDNTFTLLRDIGLIHNNVRTLRLAKNSGSHAAIIAGIVNATGDGILYMAADLQDPPELIPDMVAQWQQGHKIVWAARNAEEGRNARDRFFSLLYWRLVYYFTNSALPIDGIDFALIDRHVCEAMQSQFSRNLPLHLLIAETGFDASIVYFSKPLRTRGTSGWNLGKKFLIVIETFTAFSYTPVRFMSLLGLVVSCLGLLYAAFIITNYLLGNNLVQGWSSLIVTVLVLGGIQMMMLGVLGEYLYLALKEIRNPPRFIIDEKINFPSAAEAEKSVF